MIKSGDKFGRLTVIKDTGKRFYGYVLWKCKCECGKTKTIASGYLQRGTKSCGCLQTEASKKPKPHKVVTIKQNTWNRIGITINRLTLIDLKKEGIKKPLRAILKCSCGNVIERDYHEFIKGKIKSCGCLSKERSEKAQKKKIAQEIEAEQRKKERESIPYSYRLYKDFSGQKIGSLTVLYWCGVQLDKHGKPSIPLWYCKCDCGEHTVVTSQAFSYKMPSCGCEVKEFFQKHLKEQRNKSIQTNKRKFMERLEMGLIPGQALRKRDHRRINTVKEKLLNYYNWTCAFCAESSHDRKQLHAHHIKSFTLFIQSRFLPCNHILLCKGCHEALHRHFDYRPIPFKEHLKYIHEHSWIVWQLTNIEADRGLLLQLTG